MKKIILFTLCLFVSIGLWAQSGTCGKNLTWTIVDDVLTISGTGAMDDYDEVLNNGGSYSLNTPWASYTFSHAIINEGVTSIGYNAFRGCRQLTSVAIPNSVTSIGQNAFAACSGLTSVNITDLASWCNIEFGGCFSNPTDYAHKLVLNGTEIKDLVIPEGITEVKDSAFYGCSGLTSITIPNSVTSIGRYAFDDCSGLTSVTIGNSVTSIGDYAFSGCYGLISLNISDLSSWCNIEFGDYANPTSYAHKLVLNGTEIKDLVIPEGITEVKGSAFRGCRGLTSVTIGNSVTSIGDIAFKYCDGLTSVTIGNSVTSIGFNAFLGCGALTNVTIPSSVDNMDKTAFDSCPIEVLKIDNTKYCSSEYFGKKMKEVEIGNSVASIKKDAFYGCKSLSNLIIGESVAEIEPSAFKNTNLTTIYSFAVHPPKILDHPFDYDTYTQATLYVPTGAAFTRYYSAQYWRNFKNMEEFNTTEVNTINIKELPAELNYYNLQGQRIVKLQKGINIAGGKKVIK